MQCDICGQKKATVHLTEIVDEQMSEMHLCEDCAREKSVQMEQQFGLADLLAGLTDFGKQFSKESESLKTVCPNCGLTYENFKKLGRLGCSVCYEAFKDQLGVLLKKIHGSSCHLGKSPTEIAKETGLPQAKTPEEELAQLKERLHQAIQNEDFEVAVELRDKIRSLESKDSAS